MKLSRYSDYALRLLIHLATFPDEVIPIRRIAAIYGISQNHLMKIAHDLGRAGIIETVRGRKGGLRLGRPAARIPVGTIIRHTETRAPVVDCGSCLIAAGCGLPAMFGEAQEAFLSVLDRYSLADAASRSRDLLGLFARADDTAAPPVPPGGAGHG